MKKKVLSMGMVCVILLGILCGCGGGTASGGGCKTEDELMETIMTAMYKDKDASKIYDLIYEERQVAIEENAKEHGIYGTDVIIANMQSDLDNVLDEITRKIGEGWNYDSIWSGYDEKHYVENSEEEWYDILKFNNIWRQSGMEDFTAEEGMVIRLVAYFKTSDGEIATDTNSVYTYIDESTGEEKSIFGAEWTYVLAKVDGKWYLMEFDTSYSWLDHVMITS